MFKAHFAFFHTIIQGRGSKAVALPEVMIRSESRWAAFLTPVHLPRVWGEHLCARLEFTATTEQPFLKDKQACFLILLIQNVSWELDFRVEYNYSFLSDLTLHSWEPNLVEKTKFRVVLLDMKSERFVYEICWKCAVLVFSCQTAEKPRFTWRSSQNWTTEEVQLRAGSGVPLTWGFLNIYNLPNSFSKLTENDVISFSPMETRSTMGCESIGFYLRQQLKMISLERPCSVSPPVKKCPVSTQEAITCWWLSSSFSLPSSLFKNK